MEVTVQATAWYNKSHPEEEDEEEEDEAEAAPTETEAQAEPVTEARLKQQAAASAVAVALALRDEGSLAVEQQPQAGVYVGQPSAWKSVMRSAQITQRSTQFTRKSRGNVR
jgi:hypothetical protein